jgi:hypothetical protein
VLSITGNTFEIRTASGNLLKGTLRLHQTGMPLQMDLLHADGTVWEAIYEEDDAGLRLNYVEAAGTIIVRSDYLNGSKHWGCPVRC